MPTLMPETVRDIAIAYQKTEMNPRKWVDLTRNYRNYYWARLTETNLEKVTRNSKTFNFNYMINGYRNGQYDSFFQPDTLNRQNLGLTGTASWSMYKTHWALDRREPSWPSSGASGTMLFNHLKMQESNMWTGIFEDGEEALWTLATYPNDGTGGEIVPWGIPYSVTSTSATSTVAQTGGHPTSYSSVYGNSRTTYPQLKNWNGTYSAVSDGDLGNQLEDMVDLMHWKAPKPVAEEMDNDQMGMKILSHRQPFKEYGSLLRASNDNLGNDNGRYRPGPNGSHVFMGFTWEWVDALTQPYLRDGVTANPCYNSAQPIYCLNWDTFKIFAADDFWMKVNPPISLTDPHNTTTFWVDSMHNLVNLDPGQNGVLTRA